MARDIWITLDDDEYFPVRTDLAGRGGLACGTDLYIRFLNLTGRKLDRGRETPRHLVRIVRADWNRDIRQTVYHCERVHPLVDCDCTQGGLFQELP